MREKIDDYSRFYVRKRKKNNRDNKMRLFKRI